MQIFYKLFVSEKEVLNNLPLMPSRRLKENKLDNLIKSVRKLLFFRKLRKFLNKEKINEYSKIL
jgi:hypothetical protein